MNLHKHQLYSLEQQSESFNIWSASIRINSEGKSLIMILGPGAKCTLAVMIVFSNINTTMYIILK